MEASAAGGGEHGGEGGEGEGGEAVKKPKKVVYGKKKPAKTDAAAAAAAGGGGAAPAPTGAAVSPDTVCALARCPEPGPEVICGACGARSPTTGRRPSRQTPRRWCR